MYKLLLNKGQLFALLLGLIVIVIFFVTVISGLGASGYTTSDDLNMIMKNSTDPNIFSFFETGLMLTAALIIIAVVIAVLYGLFHVISSPKDSLKGIIALAAVLIIFFIFYSTASSDMQGPISNVVQKFGVSENQSKLISAGINTTGVMAAIAVFTAIASEIRNLFK